MAQNQKLKPTSVTTMNPATGEDIHTYPFQDAASCDRRTHSSRSNAEEQGWCSSAAHLRGPTARSQHRTSSRYSGNPR